MFQPGKLRKVRPISKLTGTAFKRRQSVSFIVPPKNHSVTGIELQELPNQACVNQLIRLKYQQQREHIICHFRKVFEEENTSLRLKNEALNKQLVQLKDCIQCLKLIIKLLQRQSRHNSWSEGKKGPQTKIKEKTGVEDEVKQVSSGLNSGSEAFRSSKNVSAEHRFLLADQLQDKPSQSFQKQIYQCEQTFKHNSVAARKHSRQLREPHKNDTFFENKFLQSHLRNQRQAAESQAKVLAQSAARLNEVYGQSYGLGESLPLQSFIELKQEICINLNNISSLGQILTAKAQFSRPDVFQLLQLAEMGGELMKKLAQCFITKLAITRSYTRSLQQSIQDLMRKTQKKNGSLREALIIVLKKKMSLDRLRGSQRRKGCDLCLQESRSSIQLVHQLGEVLNTIIDSLKLCLQ